MRARGERLTDLRVTAYSAYIGAVTTTNTWFFSTQSRSLFNLSALSCSLHLLQLMTSTASFKNT